MTKPFSIAYKQKAVERLSGRNASSARQVSRETGVSQETLSRWLREAHSLPVMPRDQRKSKAWTIDEKIRILSVCTKLTGEELTGFLEREGLLMAEVEQWRLSLDEEGQSSKATRKRIGKLERELARPDNRFDALLRPRDP